VRTGKGRKTDKPARELMAAWDDGTSHKEEFTAEERYLLFYKSPKTIVTMYLDADVVEWFRGKRYQSKINWILRLAMVHEMRERRISKSRRE